MKKNNVKRCNGYSGLACVCGKCPIALFHEAPHLFERKPICRNCFYYLGCKDCCFKGTDLCTHEVDDYDSKN